MTYKRGDLVKCIESYYGFSGIVNKGDIGVIISTRPSRPSPDIYFKVFWFHQKVNLIMCQNEIELLKNDT